MSYHHFTPVERGKLELMAKNGKSHQEMADELGVHRTSVLRELRRNGPPERYEAHSAQKRYVQRRKACRPNGKLAYEPLREYVVEKIAEEDWSPELVAGRLALEYPDRSEMRVCHETVYRAIYTTSHYLSFLRVFLVQARPKRRKRGQGKKRRAPLIPNRVSIAHRPAVVEQRTEPGHWEGDLVVGKGQDGFILTLVERSARLLEAVKLEAKRAEDVRRAVVAALLDRPISWVKTLTFDNGSEFREHDNMTRELGAAIYFADPYSAYQRGSNEQVNGLIRRYLPKGTRFKDLTQTKLDAIVLHINNRPRKCLGYRTPNEVFQLQRQQLLCALRA